MGLYCQMVKENAFPTVNADVCITSIVCSPETNNSQGNDACDVTLSVYPHRANLKNMPDHGGNRTYDLWNTSPMLCQLSYAVWSVRVCDRYFGTESSSFDINVI